MYLEAGITGRYLEAGTTSVFLEADTTSVYLEAGVTSGHLEAETTSVCFEAVAGYKWSLGSKNFRKYRCAVRSIDYKCFLEIKH